ncbi:DUF2244 domain-containing protein [Marinobacter koreensis]|uniref:DUF2244 domain-containing protein n=1 Tax=Marinobacter koreensis TaxID=335974 RepID=UPI003622AA6B
MVERLRYPGGLRLLLTPNRSLSWRGNVRIWLLLALVSGIIAGGWALAGVWFILPFAGLELMGVAAGIYVTSRNCQRKEVVTIEGDTIHIESGLNRKEHDWILPVRNTRLESFPPTHLSTATESVWPTGNNRSHWAIFSTTPTPMPWCMH